MATPQASTRILPRFGSVPTCEGRRPVSKAIHDDFVRDAGYNGWAAAGRTVVLYPQVTPSTANPNGCWDYWGYTGDDYRVKNGPQMRAVRAMVDWMLEPRD